MRRGASEITFDLFPKSLKHGGGIYPLKYRFEPAHVMDGITLTLPVSVLNQVEPCRFEWLVMGMLRDKIAAHDIHFTGTGLDLGVHDERDEI
jgi:Domain of unknown function (DUF3418).